MPYDGPYSELMERHGFIPADRAAPKFFPVEARKLYDETGEEIPGYRRIVRTDSAKTLNITTDSYKVITNEEAYGTFEDELRKSSLDLTDMRIGTDYAREGARVFRQYLLPAHQVEVKPGVAVALRLLMLNSYDGSLRFQGKAGAFNFVCANTSIHGNEISGFKIRHSGDIDLTGAVAGLVKAAQEHFAEAAKWRIWPSIRIADLQARALIQATPTIAKSTVDHLVHAYMVARDTDELQGGPNLWTLFNVLTAWSTHGNQDEADARRGFGAQVRTDRETSVRKLVAGPEWARAIAG